MENKQRTTYNSNTESKFANRGPNRGNPNRGPNRVRVSSDIVVADAGPEERARFSGPNGDYIIDS